MEDPRIEAKKMERFCSLTATILMALSAALTIIALSTSGHPLFCAIVGGSAVFSGILSIHQGIAGTGVSLMSLIATVATEKERLALALNRNRQILGDLMTWYPVDDPHSVHGLLKAITDVKLSVNGVLIATFQDEMRVTPQEWSKWVAWVNSEEAIPVLEEFAKRDSK